MVILFVIFDWSVLMIFKGCKIFVFFFDWIIFCFVSFVWREFKYFFVFFDICWGFNEFVSKLIVVEILLINFFLGCINGLILVGVLLIIMICVFFFVF